MLQLLQLSELIDMLKANGCQGVYLAEQRQRVIILYADGVAMSSDIVGIIQNKIAVLVRFLLLI